jgi:hypothetical protein
VTDRNRLRRGREVFYYPTAAEETALGAGPWPALITQVNADGTCDLHVDTPNDTTVGAVLASPLITATDPGAALTSPLTTTADADATYGQPEADLINELKTDLNATVVQYNLVRAIVVELKADVNILATLVNTLRTASGRKGSVVQGGGQGQFSLLAGPAAV